jgi:adenylosuccinate synthase
VDALAVTCLDRLEGEPTWRVCDGYRAPDGTVLRDLAPGPEQDLAYQERLTELLTDATPIHRDLHPDPGALVDAIAAAIGVPVGVTSYGPTAADKRFAPPWAARFDS